MTGSMTERSVMLAVIALIGFLVFLAWELTDDQPIVDLRVFRHRGFTAAVLSPRPSPSGDLLRVRR